MGRSIDNGIITVSNVSGTSSGSSLADGLEASPSLSFVNDTTTGFYKTSLGVLGVSTDGVNRINLSSTSLDLKSILYIPSGSASSPGISFRNDTNSGLYRIGADNLGVSCNGVKQIDVSASNVAFTNPLSLASSLGFLNSAFTASIAPTTLTANRSVSIPDISGVLVLDTATQTLTNKTLTSPIISTISNTGTLTLPTTTGTLALVSQIPTNSSYVDLTTGQTISGIKTFSSAPVISSITNTGTLTLPTTTGTLALVSQIPTNSSYVDLTTSQTVGGSKTFISSINGTAIGSTTSSLASLYIAPASTVISGASAYYFTYLAAPVTVPSAFTGTASTLFIANAPTATGGTGYALNVAAGSSLFGGAILNSSGTVSLPSYAFSSDTASGLYLIGASNLGISLAGANVWNIGTSSNTFTQRLLGPSGSSSLPTYSYSSSTNSGTYFSAGVIYTSANGANKMAISTTATLFLSNIITIPVGSVAAPILNFAADTTTGIYQAATGTFNVALTGTQYLQISSTAMDSRSVITGPGGSNSAPTYSYGLDTNTGMYRVSAGTLGFTCAGTKQLDLSSTAAQFTAPVFSSNQPYYSVLGNSGTQSISTATDTTLTAATWNGASTSQGSGISFSAGFYTLTNAGVYMISATLYWSVSNTTGQRTIYIWKNSATQICYVTSLSSASVAPYVTINFCVKLAASDTIAIRAYQDSGGSVNINTNTVQSFTIYRLS